MKRVFASTAVAALCAFGLAACGGGGATVRSESTSTGQELIDLKKALDAGVIDQKEYDKQREKILSGE
jgi:hypothetical protein